MEPEFEIAKLKKVVPEDEIEIVITDLLQKGDIHSNSTIILPSEKYEDLNKFLGLIFSISVNDINDVLDRSKIKFFYFEFSSMEEPESEVLESHDNEQVTASLHWILPNRKELHGLWETLIYDDRLKENLLDFTKTILLFSNLGVDQNIISCNRLILLHGPPGSGKTSLAKALAQKLSIQMNTKYQFTHLFEINSHSLFSKWFSESGKLVMKMFQQIQEIIDMKSSLVIVLIDEVESIAFARGNISTNEPSDSVRVVNSVLTQLDRIKKYPNVLIIATSNLTKSIDLAFLDRADIVQYIGQPSANAIFKIISSAMIELATKKIIIRDREDDGRDEFNIETIENFSFQSIEHSPAFSNGNIMVQVCKEAVGLTGRALRKLPFLAHALFLKKDSATLREFLIAMRSAIDHTKRNKENIGQFN